MKEPQPVLLFGGASSERRVSVASAQHVSKVLPQAALLFVAPNNQIFDVTPDELARHEKAFLSDFVPRSKAGYASLAQALDSEGAHDNVYFLCFHGGEGEDGTFQAEFEKRGIAFTGSGSKASALAMDKGRAKEVATKIGLAVAQGLKIKASELAKCETSLTRMFKENGPIIVKPLGGGSTLGVYFIRRADEIKTVAATLSGGTPEDYLVEKLLNGRELTIGVADIFGELRALPPSEVLLEQNREFDYEGKYLGKGVQEITPADIPAALRDKVQQMTLDIHCALGCEGYSRSDFIVVGDTPYYLETNTLPGLTGASFLPQQLAAAGLEMKDFLNSQIALAIKRRNLGVATF